MQTITTKFIAPTNTRGSRIKAVAWIGSVTIGYQCSLSTTDAHRKAADALLHKIKEETGNTFEIIADGEMPDGTGRAYIIR